MKIRKKGKLERKLILSMAVIFLVVMVSTFTTVFIVFFEDAVEETKGELIEFGDSASSVMMKDFTEEELNSFMEDDWENQWSNHVAYGDFIDNWLKNGVDDHYNRVCETIKERKEIWGISDIFIYTPLRDENGELRNEMIIIFDLPDNDGIKYNLGEHFGPSQAFETIKKVYETGEAQLYDNTAVNASGLVLVAYSPIVDVDGSICAIVGVEASIAGIILKVFAQNIILVIDSVVNFLIFGVVVFFFLRKSIVQPVGVLSEHMNKFVSNEGALVFEPITEIHTRDEIQQMAEDFNSLAQRTIEYTKNLEIKTTEEERLRVDLDVATEIRKVVSSETTYPAFPERTDFDLCAALNHTIYNKCSFCNYFFKDTNHLIIVIGESLGNSLASMIFAILSVSYIKGFAKMAFDPYKIAVETNNQLCSIEKKSSGLTVGAIIAEIDLKTGTMRYVNAGMPPILIKKPGENFVPEKADLPFSLGQMRGVTFEQKMIQLYQGSTVIFTSFGVTEMSDPKGNKYGFERLIGVMNRISGNVYDLDKTINELEKDLEKFRSDSPTLLDTAILGFRYFG